MNPLQFLYVKGKFNHICDLMEILGLSRLYSLHESLLACWRASEYVSTYKLHMYITLLCSFDSSNDSISGSEGLGVAVWLEGDDGARAMPESDSCTACMVLLLMLHVWTVGRECVIKPLYHSPAMALISEGTVLECFAPVIANDQPVFSEFLPAASLCSYIFIKPWCLETDSGLNFSFST